MTSVCMYFQVHQPVRLKPYSFFEIGKHSDYFDDESNRFYLERISRKCYIPTNEKILELIHKTDGRFKLSLKRIFRTSSSRSGSSWTPDAWNCSTRLIITASHT